MGVSHSLHSVSSGFAIPHPWTPGLLTHWSGFSSLLKSRIAKSGWLESGVGLKERLCLKRPDVATLLGLVGHMLPVLAP